MQPGDAPLDYNRALGIANRDPATMHAQYGRDLGKQFLGLYNNRPSYMGALKQDPFAQTQANISGNAGGGSVAGPQRPAQGQSGPAVQYGPGVGRVPYNAPTIGTPPSMDLQQSGFLQPIYGGFMVAPNPVWQDPSISQGGGEVGMATPMPNQSQSHMDAYQKFLTDNQLQHGTQYVFRNLHDIYSYGQ